jgi:hypothetical protein
MEFVINQLPDERFELVNGATQIGTFNTVEDAEKAKTIAESESKEPTGTWVDDGAGVEYPEGTDNYHSGEEKLTGEARIDALCRFLHEVHGIHVPFEISPKD